VEHHPVAEPFHGAAAALLRRFVDDLRERDGELGRRLVPALLRERGVAGQVEKGDRRRISGGSP
jgi:hypothetical protein